MKNFLLIPFLTFCALQSFAQNQHFQLEFRLRVENNLVYCDVIAKEEYLVLGFQFGFYHNSSEVEFIEVVGGKLKDLNYKYNEICPKYVRMLGVESSGKNLHLHAGDTLFTLVYQEQTPQDHFICMMPGTGGDHCSTFLREVLYADTISKQLVSYIVDDVCVDYQIQAGQIILSEQNLNTGQPALFEIQQQGDQILLHSKQEILSGKYNIYINDNNGRLIKIHPLNTNDESISIASIPSGMYFYQIRDSKSFVQSGKLLIH